MSQKSTPLKHKRNIDLQSRRCLGIVVTFERLFFSGIVLFIVGAFVVLAFNAWQNRIVSIDGLSRRVGLLRSHEDNFGYGTGELPPMGGTHNQVWQNCGVYETPLRSDLAVHSLEHGAVWITYHRCCLDYLSSGTATRTSGEITRNHTRRKSSPVKSVSWFGKPRGSNGMGISSGIKER